MNEGGPHTLWGEESVRHVKTEAEAVPWCQTLGLQAGESPLLLFQVTVSESSLRKLIRLQSSSQRLLPPVTYSFGDASARQVHQCFCVIMCLSRVTGVALPTHDKLSKGPYGHTFSISLDTQSPLQAHLPA